MHARGREPLHPSAPVEIFESEYPLRVRAFNSFHLEFRRRRYPRRPGLRREFEVLEDSVLTVRWSNHMFAAQGPRGSQVILKPDRPDREELMAIETRMSKRAT